MSKPKQGWRRVKIGRAEAIHTWIAFFQRYLCLSVCSVGTWEQSRLLLLKTNLVARCSPNTDLGRAQTFGNRWSSHSSVSGWSLLKSNSALITKANGLRKNLLLFHFSHISTIEKIDGELSVSCGSVIALSTSKIKRHLPTYLNFAADPSRCSWTISNSQ